MNEFNRMTVVAAAEVIACFKSHSDMEVLEVEWDITGRCAASSKTARVASLAAIATGETIQVITENGLSSLARAIVELAIKAPEKCKNTPEWKKLVSGLRFDGFDLVEVTEETAPVFAWDDPVITKTLSLVKMLPSDIPGLDFREAESEVNAILDRFNFSVAKGHLRLALSAFQRGEWSSANGELRKFYESYLNEIADVLGCDKSYESKAKRDFLGGLEQPFLLTDYNEWNPNNQKPQYVQGLMSRMHPHGGHPGLSEEEDATFRLQISLVTARLFLRRLDQRNASQ